MKQVFSYLMLIGFALTLLLAPTHAQARKTGDGIVPAIETVCDGDPFSFGLCNAYCEALDCDSATPLGTPRACANKLNNYLKKSGGAFPPCENTCPCTYDLTADQTEFETLEDPIIGTTTCGAVGPAGENGLHFHAEQEEGFIRGDIYYYFGVDAPTCNILVSEFDGIAGGEITSSSHAITAEELTACQAQVQKLCPDQ